MTQLIDAGASPETANQMIASAVAEPPAAAEAAPTIPMPPDGRVELIAGIINSLEGTTVTDAVVRELNGADEEVIASPTVARSMVKFIQAVVGRGTVSIGGEKPTGAQFDGLLIGDRELLMMEIRKATYGPSIQLITVCPQCGDRDDDYAFDLNSVEIRQPQRPEDVLYGFSVDLPSGKVANVTLPRAADQDALLAADKKNEGELNTMMLYRCVSKVDGQQVFGEATVRNLSIRDRNALLKEITDRTPGPRIGEAKRTCNACEQEFDLGIGLLDIFRP